MELLRAHECWMLQAMAHVLSFVSLYVLHLLHRFCGWQRPSILCCITVASTHLGPCEALIPLRLSIASVALCLELLVVTLDLSCRLVAVVQAVQQACIHDGVWLISTVGSQTLVWDK